MMKKFVVTGIAASAFLLAACEPMPEQPESGAPGIVSQTVTEDGVTILYKTAETTERELQSIARRACNSQNKAVGQGTITRVSAEELATGADRKAQFSCVDYN